MPIELGYSWFSAKCIQVQRLFNFTQGIDITRYMASHRGTSFSKPQKMGKKEEAVRLLALMSIVERETTRR